MDAELSQLYGAVRERLSPDGKKSQSIGQRIWHKFRNDVCSGPDLRLDDSSLVKCVLFVDRDRSVELQGLLNMLNSERAEQDSSRTGEIDADLERKLESPSLTNPPTAFTKDQAGTTPPSAAPQCAQPESEIEKTVCGIPALAKADAGIMRLVQNLSQSAIPEHKASLMHGQEAWLKLRARACPDVDNDDQDLFRWGDDDDVEGKCLLNVYKARKEELVKLASIEAEAKKYPSLAHQDFEKIMDDLAFGESGLALYILDVSGRNIAGRRETARSCRDLFILNRGMWDFESSDPGRNNYAYALTTCIANLHGDMAVADKTKTIAIDFKNLSKYSNEFLCLPRGCFAGPGELREANDYILSFYSFGTYGLTDDCPLGANNCNQSHP